MNDLYAAPHETLSDRGIEFFVRVRPRITEVEKVSHPRQVEAMGGAEESFEFRFFGLGRDRKE